MKKLITIGLLALTFNASVDAKSVEKLENIQHQALSLKKVNFGYNFQINNVFITSCGEVYSFTSSSELSDAESLAFWDAADWVYCGGGSYMEYM